MQSGQLYYFTTIDRSPISVIMFTEIESQLCSQVPHCAVVKLFVVAMQGKPEKRV